MIKQSDLALAAWKATERTLDAVVTINKIDYKTTDIASISYDAGGYTGDTFGIGSNYENSVTIKFAHLIEGLKPGMTVWPKIGIKTSNGYEYSSLGLFIVSDDIQMDRNNDETTIRAYDQMYLLEGTYTSKLTYPAKMTSVIAEIANLAGVLLNTTDISRLPVQVNLPSAITGQTYRNAIGMIAQFYAGFVTFDRDGKLTIRTIAEPDYTLDPSQYEQGGLTKNEAPYKIGGIQCEVTTTTTDSTGQSTETTNTLQVGATSGSQIKLTNNLMTMDRLTSIWQQLQSLTFYPFSLNWFGNPAIEAGDWLTLQDTKGNKFNVPNNGYTMTFDGSLSAVSKADQTSTSSSSYAWRGELSQYVADLGGRQGASGNYIYGTDTTEPPYGAKFNDIWYKQNGNKVELWTYERQADGTGKWVLTVSDATGEEVKAKVDQVELEAKTGVANAENAVAIANGNVEAANFAKDTALKAQVDAGTAMSNSLQALNAANGLSDKVTTNTASIDNNTKMIALKASQTNVDTLAGRVTTAEGSLKVMNDQIAQTVSKSELTTTLGGYATQSWTSGQISTTANQIKSTVSNVQTQVNNSAVGANLLRNTRTFEGWKVWGGAAAGKGFSIEDKVSDSGQYQMVHIFNNVDGQNSDGPYWPGENLFLTAGQVYTISIWAHTLGNSMQPVSWKLWLNWDKDHTYQSVNITDTTNADWTHYSATFTATVGGQVNNVRIIPYFSGTSAENVGGSVYLLKPKLEHGCVATDFSVNPADNATVTQFSSLEQTVNGIQTTVAGKASQTQFTQLDNQITSVVGQINNLGQKNLIANSLFQYNWQNSWGIASSNKSNWYTSNFTWSWLDGYQGICANIVQSQTESWPHVQSTDVQVPDPGVTAYSASVYVNIDWVETYCVLDMSFYNASGTRTFHDTTASAKGMNFLKLENIVSPKDAVRVHIELHVHDHGHVAFIEPMFVQDNNVGRFVPDNATGSQITQLQDDINLRVTKNGVVNAVNVSPEGIQIYGNKLHITASTYIDNTVIKSAMIDTITADKITAGTLNGNNVNVINLNASHITTGTLSGSSLQINLNTGSVVFQKGRIHSANNNIDINIDSGYLSVADDKTRVMLKNGQLQLTQPNIFDTNGNWYFRLFNGGGTGDAWAGTSLIGRDSVTVSNAANAGGATGWSDNPIGTATFSGLFTGKGNGNWMPTVLGGAERGVFIKGGNDISFAQNIMDPNDGGVITNGSPYIAVGATGPTVGWWGNRIVIEGEYVHIPTAYRHTTGAAPNLYVANDGALVRSTSASKYKTNIVRGRSAEYGKKLIQLPTATWIDKASLQRYNDDPSQPMPGLNYGMIAEDLAAAGLEHLVVRNKKGGLEGIQYERIAVALLPLLSEWKQTIDNQEQEINELKEKVGNI